MTIRTMKFNIYADERSKDGYYLKSNGDISFRSINIFTVNLCSPFPLTITGKGKG